MAENSAETIEAKPRRKRRWWLWLFALLAIGLVSFVFMPPASDPEFAFLDRHHPTKKTWAGSVFQLGWSPDYKCMLYVFEKRDAPGVLPALKSELTRAKGYDREGGGAEEEAVTFDRQGSGGAYYAIYLPSSASEWLVSDDDKVKTPEGGCLVITVRPLTWMERQIRATRRFLHLE